MISRFNRDTVWLATGVLGAVIFAALMVAVQECQRKATEAERDLLLNANPGTVASVVAKSSNSNGEMTPGQGSSVDHAFTEISPKQNPSSQMEAAASTPTPVLAFSPEINRHDVQANAGSWTAAHRQDSERVMGLKVPRARFRSSVRLRFVDVKMRLIALWHQSLARSEKSRTWTGFSKP